MFTKTTRFFLKKRIQRRIATFLLCVFSLNLLIVPDSKPMAAPLAITTIEAVAVPAFEMLVMAGSAIAGLAIAASHTLYDRVDGLMKTTPPSYVIAHQAPQADLCATVVAQPIIQDIKSKMLSASVQQECIPVVRSSVAQGGAAVATAEANSSCQSAITHSVVGHLAALSLDGQKIDALANQDAQIPLWCADGDAFFCCYPLEDGCEIRTNDNRGFFVIRVNQGNQLAAHATGLAIAFAWNDLVVELKNHPQFRRETIAILHDATACMFKTQSKRLSDSIPACFALSSLDSTHTLLDFELASTVEALQKAYFHHDGTICATALLRQTGLSARIIDFIDSMVQFTRNVIKQVNLISPSDYKALQSISKPCCNRRGCGHQFLPPEQAAQFNHDVIRCIEACRKGDFETAEKIAVNYQESTVFRKIIEQRTAAIIEARSSLYDSQGIAKAVHADPAYRAYKDRISSMTATGKGHFHTNLLARSHLKDKIIESLHVPGAVPACVIEAAYALLGTDCSTLTDIAKYTACVEQIIQTAAPRDRDTLIHAFYEKNGVLKELANQVPEVKELTFAKDLCLQTFTTERNQLNKLVCTKIINQDKAALVDQAIDQLKEYVAAADTTSRADMHALFVQSFEAVLQQNDTPDTEAPSQEQPTIEVGSAAGTQTTGAVTGGGGAQPPKKDENNEQNEPKKKIAVISKGEVVATTLVGFVEKGIKYAHIFSPDHKSRGIMDLGINEADIVNKFKAIVRTINAAGKLIEKTNVIRTFINGLQVEIHVHIINGMAVGLDGYIGHSARTSWNYIINYF